MPQNNAGYKKRRIDVPRIEISFGFFFCLSLFLILDQGRIGTMCVIAVLLHELGHLLMMLWFKVKVKKICFSPFGIRIERGNVNSLWSETMINLSGPFMNLFLAAGFGVCRRLEFSAVNLALGLFELCPLPSLDGGQAIFGINQHLFSLEKAQKLSRLIEWGTLGVIFLCAGTLFYQKKNFTLLVLLLGLCVSMYQKEINKEKSSNKKFF